MLGVVRRPTARRVALRATVAGIVRPATAVAAAPAVDTAAEVEGAPRVAEVGGTQAGVAVAAAAVPQVVATSLKV